MSKQMNFALINNFFPGNPKITVTLRSKKNGKFPKINLVNVITFGSNVINNK